MVFGGAQGIRSTRVVRQTRYFTHVVFANFIVGTIFVLVAFDFVAPDVRVPVETGFAVADGLMVDGRTLGVSPANHLLAHVDALCLRVTRKL